MPKIEPLPAEMLYRRCAPESLSFETTAELEPLSEILGQDRAVEAIELGIGMRRDGYNLFVFGSPGTGRHSLVREFLERAGKRLPPPDDWCYVNNFDLLHQPKAIRLPAGRASKLHADVDRLLSEIQAALPAAFESEEYRRQRQALEEQLKERQGAIFEAISERARKRDIALIRTPIGLAFAPVHGDEVIPPDEFSELPEAERRHIQQDVQALEKELQEAMHGMPRLAHEIQRQIAELNQRTTMFAVGSLIDELIEAYRAHEPVVAYLEAMKADIVAHVELFQPEPDGPSAVVFGRRGADDTPAHRRYGINVIVDNREQEGAPIIYEPHPTYANLVGRIEHKAEMGALVTDFQLIKAGVLHRANSGFLVLDAEKVLVQPFAWEGLKQALRAGRLRIESLGQAYSLISTVSLEPEPIPLSLKVVLIGDRFIYHLLQAYDPEFLQLFKIGADFDERTERSESSERRFAQLLGTIARRDNLRPLDRTAVARLIEEAARLAGDAERLSTRIARIADLVRESDHYTEMADKKLTGAVEVQRAIDAHIRRSNRVQERLREEILRGTVLIDTAGARVGQINGLSVLQVGDYAFGQPSRITARLRLGAGKVIDIEREVELGGPIHSKGVLILSSFLAARYAQDFPLSLAASLVFEQSYGGVEGDSASSAELYALLSALAEIPVRQSFAVTGSVNQHGAVQAIGGVNEKIEGFFDICQARGLSGEQGVLIPSSNVKHLMLREDVVEACAAGKFRIITVETIDQGIAILTGVEAGERGLDGKFPEGTVNRAVEDRLIAFAERRRAFGADKGGEAKP